MSFLLSYQAPPTELLFISYCQISQLLGSLTGGWFSDVFYYRINHICAPTRNYVPFYNIFFCRVWPARRAAGKCQNL